MPECYVVLNTELGWDSVVGVYNNFEAAKEHKESVGKYGYIHTSNIDCEYLDE